MEAVRLLGKDNNGLDAALKVNSSGSIQADISTNDLGRDAWGRAKTITDYSLFGGLWSLSVPNRVWLQYNDIGAGSIEQTQIDNTLIQSKHGHLLVTGNSVTDVYLRSRRHPRYQANRGLLYSSALILPNPTYTGTRDFGLISEDVNGVYFQLDGDGASWTMNVVRNTTVSGVTSTQTVDITSSILEKIPTFDPSKGHTYDIQMEWRGIGDFFIYVDLVKVYTFAMLGNLTELSISNPALPVGFKCSGATVGDDLTILVGCVDVTSEGGGKQNKLYASVNTGKSLLLTTNTGKAILAVRLPTHVTYDGASIPYTRDMILTKMTTFCKDEAFIAFYQARDITATNIAASAGWTTSTDSLFEWKMNDDGVLDTAFQLDKASMREVFTTRHEKDISITHYTDSEDGADFSLVGGDIILLELQSDGNSTGGCTFQFAEEV